MSFDAKNFLRTVALTGEGSASPGDAAASGAGASAPGVNTIAELVADLLSATDLVGVGEREGRRHDQRVDEGHPHLGGGRHARPVGVGEVEPRHEHPGVRQAHPAHDVVEAVVVVHLAVRVHDGVDVTGDRFGDVRSSIVPAVLAAYPRCSFKQAFSALFADQASRKPTCPAAGMAAAGMLEEIARAPFDS